MGDTAPLRLPEGTDGTPDDASTTKIRHWIDRLVAAGVEPRSELMLAGDGVADAALAAARLVGPRGRVVAVASTEREAGELRGRVAATGAGQVEVVVGFDAVAANDRPVPLALHLAASGESPADRASALARCERALTRGGRSLALDAPG